MKRLRAAEVKSFLETNTALLVDVREPWEFDICHIDGSINMPMSRLTDYVEDIQQHEHCVVICHHGIRSMQVIQYLLQLPKTELINLEGGIDAWAREIDHDMPVY